MSDTPASYRRDWKSLFIRPTQQFKLTLAILSIGILVTAVLLGYLVLKVSAVVSAAQVVQPDVAVFAQQELGKALDVMIFGQLFLWVSSLFVGVLISHKIYGPMVPILRQIRSLGEGNFTSRVHLRKGDDLEEIATALNELADQMEKRKQP